MLYRASVLTVYVGLRVWILFHGKVFTSYDTFSYALRNDPSVDRGHLVSLTGNAPRLWGVPAFYALLHDDAARVLAQWSIGTISWALLAFVLAGFFASQPMKALVGASVLGLALTPVISSWDFAILSESLSLSLGVLVLAFFLFWFRTRSVPALLAVGLIGLWWIFTRPEIRVFAGVVVVAILATQWRRRDRRGGAAVGLVCLVLAAGCVWCTAINPKVSAAHRAYSSTGLTHNDALLVYRLRLHVFPDPATKQLFERELGMPKCPGAETVAARATWDGEDFAREFESCRELAEWARQNDRSLWLRFAAASPVLYAGLIWQLMGESLAGAAYADIPSVLLPVERVWFPTRRHNLPFLLALSVVIMFAVRFTNAHRSHRRLVSCMLGLTAAASVGGFVVVSWGAGEYSRFGLVSAVAFRLAMAVLVLASVEAGWQAIRRGDRPSWPLSLIVPRQSKGNRRTESKNTNPSRESISESSQIVL